MFLHRLPRSVDDDHLTTLEPTGYLVGSTTPLSQVKLFDNVARQSHMGRLGMQSTTADRQFALAWVGMGVVMSLAVAMIDFLPLPLEAVYVFAAGVMLREALGLAYWALQK